MKLTPRSLEDLSDVRCDYFTCGFDGSDDEQGEVLIVACYGRCAEGCEGNGDCLYLAAMAKAGLTAFDPRALIFDMTDLDYQWGDMMSAVVCSGQSFYPDEELPTAIVTSEKSREGLSSLVRDELDGDPQDWLFDDLAAALSAVEQKRGSR